MTVTSPGPQRRIALASLAASLLLALAGGVVAAHADLVSATPANGSTVTSSPGMAIVLTFSEPLRTGSKADITGPGNSPIGTATIDATDTKKLTFTPPAPLGSGGYAVAWTSIAQDGDVLRGKVVFTVQAAASAVPTSGPSAVTSASPSAIPTAAPSPSPSPAPTAASGADALLPVIAAILAIAVLGLVLLRSRRASARR